MFKIIILLIFLILADSGFLEQQKEYPRVRNAVGEKLEIVKEIFSLKGIQFPPAEIFLRIFKSEKVIELWSRSGKNDPFIRVKEYPFCATSGTIGPKRKQGDLQIPEGFYFIDRFNPVSNFHLSLGINYPNESDKILSGHQNLGGDIFIHGDCVTIGCIPITDDLIKELYIIAVYAKNNGQENIPVHIFPIQMSSEKLAKINDLTEGKYRDFWANLKTGYDLFKKENNLPEITIDHESGLYQFK